MRTHIALHSQFALGLRLRLLFVLALTCAPLVFLVLRAAWGERDLVTPVLALPLSLFLGWLGARFLVLSPVKALARSGARLANGDLAARASLPLGHDELGQLAAAFHRMADIIERREREQQRGGQKLQALSRRLVEAQETERRRIACELHDEIGQSLTAVELNIHAALSAPGTNGLEPRLRAVAEVIEDVLGQVQDLSLNLRPSMLDDLGLESALRWLSNRQAELTGLRSEFRAEPLRHRLDPVIETECFRVAQEALTNVVCHAQARTFRLELSARDSSLHLRICDDGIGFDAPALRRRAAQGASLGLLSMEERALLTGGALECRSTPGQGTEIHAWFPLKWRTEETMASA